MAAIKAPTSMDEHNSSFIIKPITLIQHIGCRADLQGRRPNPESTASSTFNEDEKRKRGKSKADSGIGADEKSALQASKLDRKHIKCYGCGGHVIRSCPP